MQHLGGNVPDIESPTQAEELPQPLVLCAKRRQELGDIRARIALGSDLTKAYPAGPALFGPLLEPYERGKHRLAEYVGYIVAPWGWGEEAKQGEAQTQNEEDGVSARVAAVGQADHVR
jgi:hypothetical protein